MPTRTDCAKVLSDILAVASKLATATAPLPDVDPILWDRKLPALDHVQMAYNIWHDLLQVELQAQSNLLLAGTKAISDKTAELMAKYAPQSQPE